MKCPYCGREMDLGRVSAGGHRADWIPEGKGLPLFAWSQSPGVELLKYSLSSKGTPAFRCESCRKVIIEY